MDNYRASSLKLFSRADEKLETTTPPWIMMPPSMEVYEDYRCQVTK